MDVIVFVFHSQESTLVELHRALGSSYETVAACGLKLRELLERSHGRLHGTAKLIGQLSCGLNMAIISKTVYYRECLSYQPQGINKLLFMEFVLIIDLPLGVLSDTM